MDTTANAASTVLGLAKALFAAFLGIFEAIIVNVRTLLEHQGVPKGIQTIIIVTVLVMALAVSVQALGGIARLLIVAFLVLLAVQALT